MEIADRIAGLNDAAFAKLEVAGKVELSHGLRSRLSEAVRECSKVFAFSQCLSPESRRATGALAKHGPEFLRAVERLRQTPSAIHALLYDEGTALAVFFDGKAIDSHERGNQMLDELPCFLKIVKELVDGAKRRMLEINAMKPNRRPANTHIDVLCRRTATIFEEAGGSASITGDRVGPFARFLSEFWKHLPGDLRPRSADAMVMQAQRTLKRVRERQRGHRRPSQSRPESEGLDKAIAKALEALDRNSALRAQ